MVDSRDFTVNIDGGEDVDAGVRPAGDGNKIWRETSYDFNPNNHHNNRVSKFSFLSQSSNVDDIDYEETSKHGEVGEEEEMGSKEFRNSLRRPSFSPAVANGGGEVVRCASYQRRHSMLRTKTKSRLIDPDPEPRTRKAVKLGKLRSGLLGRATGMLAKGTEEEEDDPLFDEDIPDEYKRTNVNAFTIVQWVSLVLIVGALICSLSVPKLKGRKLRGLLWWKWEVLVLVLICGRLVSGWGVRILVFFIDRNFLLRKRVLYFVYGVREAVQNCIWLGLVLIGWHYLFHKTVERQTNIKFLLFVNKVLVSFLVAAVLWLVKTLVVKILASSFHVSTFFDRIQESVFNQYVIETLSGLPSIEIKNIEEDEERTTAEVWKHEKPQRTSSQKFSRESSEKQGEGILIDHLHKLKPKNISAWNMKRLIRIVRHGELSMLDKQILESTNGDEPITQIRSESEAKVAARKIFQNVVKRGSRFIYLEDVLRFMLEDEALKTMSLLGGSPESEKISQSSLKNWVVNAFRERRALALTLNDTKTAVNKLHHMVNVLVVIVIAVVSLFILGIATSRFLFLISSQIVVVAFIFGNSCKTVFEAIVFLFVMHPYDVGDQCEIDGVQMVVEEMNILTTIFLRLDNQKIIYPNSILSTKPISNYYRSSDMGDSIDFCVHIATPIEKIAIIRQRIIRFIYLEDVLRFMLEDEALKTMSLLGGSPESEKISQSSLKNWVVNAFRERRALALTLNDTKTAVNKLHHMVNVLVVIVIAVVSLFILGIATSRFLFLISSQIVVVAFIFGNSCKTVFEAIVFLFVMHPYDVGDQCEIDGVQMVVEEMNILTTVFLRLDNQKIIYPNSILSTKPISNYYRSPDMGDAIDFCVHIATPVEKIAIIRQRIISYVESKKDHWYPSPLVVPMDLVGLNDLKLSVWLRHRMNHQDMGEKWLRRAFVIEEMIKIFKELDMEYRLLSLDINIRNMPPISSTCCPNHHDHYEVEHDRI
ncbi:hypothetical protein TEA_017221 [Camellia sinensis var. sinensis]|uniref:Mechanosensitive ion channel protein n=1 Tax=Camellia sinensis var. sinensis TaxID=542762 RepID=A0A4S4DQW7_CAMSN|nr:hypothetical protein TEA_017221 [Camellia sinensis var. sinensis]